MDLRGKLSVSILHHRNTIGETDSLGKELYRRKKDEKAIVVKKNIHQCSIKFLNDSIISRYFYQAPLHIKKQLHE